MAEKNIPGSYRISHVSPWLFGAAGLLIALIITVFAVNNYRREKLVMGKVLAQEGQAVLNLTAAAARSSVRDRIFQGRASRQELIEGVQQVLIHGEEHKEIKALFLADENGVIIAHTDLTYIGTRLDDQMLDYVREIPFQGLQPVGRIFEGGEDQEPFFQVVAPFFPLGIKGTKQFFGRESARRHGNRMKPPSFDQLGEFMKELQETRYYLIAQLDMTDYQKSVRKQLVQILILSVVLLLVGLGGFISMLTLQDFKGTRRRLEYMRAFNDKLVSSIPAGIIAISSDGTVRTCNPEAEKMFQISQSETVGRYYKDTLPESLLHFIEEKRVDNAPAKDISELVIDGNGSARVLAVHMVDVAGDMPDQGGSMLLLRDLTKQKKLEVEIRRNERHTALGKMAAGVAHELRNPLSSIKGLAVILKSKTEHDRSAVEATEVMISEVERLDRSIGELLDFARPQSLTISDINIAQLLKRAIILIESDADLNRVEIKEHIDLKGTTVRGDEDRLTQVLLNIFLNSLQAMPKGGILTVSAEMAGKQLKIAVTDSGIGVKKEIQEKIFDPYFTTKNEGTGLGLSLSAKIIEDHQGTIAIESKEGNGTTVIISLPLGDS